MDNAGLLIMQISYAASGCALSEIAANQEC